MCHIVTDCIYDIDPIRYILMTVAIIKQPLTIFVYAMHLRRLYKFHNFLPRMCLM
jgi:hypothetical protein